MHGMVGPSHGDACVRARGEVEEACDWWRRREGHKGKEGGEGGEGKVEGGGMRAENLDCGFCCSEAQGAVMPWLTVGDEVSEAENKADVGLERRRGGGGKEG